MSVLKNIASFVQASLFGGTWEDLAFEIRVLKEEVGGIHQRLDDELASVRQRLDKLEGKEAPGKGRGRLSVLSSADAADAVPKAEAAAPSAETEVYEASGGLSQLSFTREQLIAEALALHPDAKEVLSRNHLPSCGSCAVSGLESLEDGLSNHGVSVEAVLAELNRLPWN
jgi:hypothetical protein